MITILEGVGLLCTICFVYYLVKTIFGFLYECISGPVNLQKQGKWAIITGATDGIGKAFAEALAAKEINIILISRSMNKLQTVAEHLETKYNVETRVIEADFSKVTETYQHIKKHLFGYEIGILVNNVGLSYPHPEYFLDLPNNDIIYTGIINCNIYSITNMCKIVMPGMVKQKKGVVINISSTAAKIPSPLLTVYGASKAFVEKFSTDLSTEYKQHGITVQCLLPGYVATKMSKIRKSTWMAPTPEDYVSHALKTTGIKDKCTGYYPHSMLVTIIHCIQYFSPQCATFIITQVMETLRKRALARQMS